MAESPTNKTTRKLVHALQHHSFRYQASVFLRSPYPDINRKNIAKIKRIISEENKSQHILFFISITTDPQGVLNPYITFFSHERLIGFRLRAASDKSKEPLINLSSIFGTEDSIDETGVHDKFIVCGKRKNDISRDYRLRYKGYINEIKENKVKDFSFLDSLPDKFRRWGFINEASRPSEEFLLEKRKMYEDS